MLYRKCYLDINCHVGNNVWIKGGNNLENQYHEDYAIKDGIVIIKEGATILEGATIGEKQGKLVVERHEQNGDLSSPADKPRNRLLNQQRYEEAAITTDTISHSVSKVMSSLRNLVSLFSAQKIPLVKGNQ